MPEQETKEDKAKRLDILVRLLTFSGVVLILGAIYLYFDMGLATNILGFEGALLDFYCLFIGFFGAFEIGFGRYVRKNPDKFLK